MDENSTSPDWEAGKTFDDLVSALEGKLDATQAANQSVGQLSTLKNDLDALMQEYTTSVEEFKFVERDGQNKWGQSKVF